MTNFGPVWLIDTLVLRILLLFRPIVTNQLARSVSFKDRLIHRNVRVIDCCYHFLLVEGVRRHLSLVATPSTARLSRGGWYQVTVSLRHPSNLSGILDNCDRGSHGARAWRVTERDCSSLWSPCAVRPVNSCRICSDARNIGLFIMATITGLPKCCHVIMIIKMYSTSIKLDAQACYKI